MTEQQVPVTTVSAPTMLPAPVITTTVSAPTPPRPVTTIVVPVAGPPGPPGPPGAAADVAVEELIEAHVADPTPHPTYDDIPSLVYIFENGLV